MSHLKEYGNLHRLYWRNQRKLLIALIILFLLFVLSFPAIIADVPFAVTLTMMGMIIPAIAVGIIYLAMRHTTAKSLSRFTKEELRRIDNTIQLIQMQEGFGVTREAVISSKGRLFLYPVKDVLWIYKHVITTEMYGVIPVSKTSTVVIAGKDRKRYAYRTKNKSNIVEFLQKGLNQYRKGIFYGYSPDWDTMFRKDIGRMISMSEEYDRKNNEMTF